MSIPDEIPADMLRGSMSNREIVLPYPEIVACIHRLSDFGHRPLGWEGWLRYPNGQVGHSAQHQGTEDLSGLSAAQAAEFCIRTIEEAHAIAMREPEAGELYFCLTTAAA